MHLYTNLVVIGIEQLTNKNVLISDGRKLGKSAINLIPVKNQVQNIT